MFIIKKIKIISKNELKKYDLYIIIFAKSFKYGSIIFSFT